MSDVFYEKVTTIFRGLSKDQRVELLGQLNDIVLADHPSGVAALKRVVPAKKSASRKRGKYWSKTFNGLIDTSLGVSGVARISGDWFDPRNNLEEHVNEGGLYVVGFRSEPKLYAVLEREEGSTALVSCGEGTAYEFDNSKQRFEGGFKELMNYLEEKS